MIKLGLLGKDISHSKSQVMYEELLNQKISYTLFDYASEKDIPSLDYFFGKIDGLSITSPYKKVFLNRVNYSDEHCEKLGAINCIKKDKEGFVATNTDYNAILEFLKESQSRLDISNVVVLGDGTMSKVVQNILDRLKVKNQVYSRKKNSDFYEIDIPSLRNTEEKSFVINTCSREYRFQGVIDKNTFFWDLNYNLDDHRKSLEGRVEKYFDGLRMLKDQAKHAAIFWGII